ncbi:hypothetical protein TCDM_06671 [Trypanosoma cruzi Dm28c]|uniref:Uncharacterized protein n=1 Tax=Trypanosoma cruzi Dm28c TaxID=1416333 RepID=V5DCA6_TRYCR|nr:hypothetical protein TCDM_06671 [Trypanosoma cruzi Dm28c]
MAIDRILSRCHFSSASLSLLTLILETVNSPVMRQSFPSCVFHRHEVMEKSEYMCKCTQLTEVYDLFCQQAKQLDAFAFADSRPNVNPTSLALHESISMTASHADYDSLTRCHILETLTEDQVAFFWEHAVMFAAEHILNSFPVSSRRGKAVMGVFITRNAVAEFSVGLITQGTWRDQRLQEAVSQFSGPHTLNKVYAELPLCAAYRKAKVRLWWESRAERVTPYRVMPPVKVILEQQQQEHVDKTQLCGYAAVNVFLCRPAASTLCGTTRKLLNGADGGVAGKAVIPAAEKRNGEINFKAAAFSFDDSHGAARCREQAPWRRSVVLHFDDLFVLEEGEHLVGVEVERLPSYKAFIPALYGHLAPFLVVTHENA